MANGGVMRTLWAGTGHTRRSAGTRERWRLHVEGLVQGVGFRPFAHSLATRLGLGGYVVNDTRGAVLEVEGDAKAVARFVDMLVREGPPLAVIEQLAHVSLRAKGERQFSILDSTTTGERQALVSPDVATCEDCLRELFNPHDRRYRYPFTNCTNCGPRFTIVRDVPYDRPRTTMADFTMCGDCAREYADPADRRFHAQPIACPACGPRLRLVTRTGEDIPGDPIEVAAELLRAGRIVAVKGLGGYHLAALAADEDAVAELRWRKHREEKPFAVMVRDLAAARELADVDAAAERVLAGPRRPIVLLPRRAAAAIADSVAPGNAQLGLMLPYTPLHHLLARRLRAPFVLTSGNVSDEPIAHQDENALARLGRIAKFFLLHDRAIHVRTDDSVVRMVRGREVPVRRARGHAPQPVVLSHAAPRPILACGGELKNTFCLLKERYAFLSHHVGDLENYATMQAFTAGIRHFRQVFDVTPEVVAYDLHPEYLSTRYALQATGVELVGVQHHHAHVASCLADNGEEGPVIGVAFDGLGFGLDGTLWGGEFLVATLRGFERAAHFEAVPMPGGTMAIRQPWRMAASYLAAAYGDDVPELAVRERNGCHWAAVVGLRHARVVSPATSSVGRLFDAVAAIVGTRDEISYEGQAAIELEQSIDAKDDGTYRAGWRDGVGPIQVRGADLVRAVAEDTLAGVPRGVVAARFHRSLARVTGDVCAAIRSRTGHATVALSGGVFQNAFLLDRTVGDLEARGFRVLTHVRVPSNDGGISFGQAAVAAACDRARTPRRTSGHRDEGGH
jgi:hydrogenase maturation protein HypF